MANAIILNAGEQFGELTVIRYIGNATHLCQCSCGNTCEVKTKTLRSGGKKSCGCKSNNTFIDLTGKTFGEWTVLNIDEHNRKRWICQCSCGTIKSVDGHELRRGNTNSCGHCRKHTNLIGRQFGEWTVISKSSEDRYWNCRCSCGNIRNVHEYSLTSGRSLSCGHTLLKYSQYKIGDKFYNLEIIEHIKNQDFKFKCVCGNEKILNINSVISGNTKSCGCKRISTRYDTLIKVNGDFKNGDARSKWQIDILGDKDKFIGYISNLDKYTSRDELAKKLGVTRTALYEASIRYNIQLSNYIDARTRGKSPEENEVLEYIKSIYSGNIICNTRKVIYPQELDIYIPDKKLAIEFNGDYWHSDIYKDANYHQNKTLDCAKIGIQLIHIFEHEWLNENLNKRIKSILQQRINGCNNVIYGRNTYIKEVDTNEAKEFCTKYHMQGHSNASIYIGCYFKDSIVAIMSFGKPRFNNDYQYEVVRYCVKDDIIILGGAEKLFEYFINKYSPLSVVTYSDISKFSGNIYLKMGFKYEEITRPNYKWIKASDCEVLSRYSTQKSKLIKLGLGSIDESEDTIMKRLGYLKVYDCGNIKLSYHI